MAESLTPGSPKIFDLVGAYASVINRKHASGAKVTRTPEAPTAAPGQASAVPNSESFRAGIE